MKGLLELQLSNDAVRDDCLRLLEESIRLALPIWRTNKGIIPFALYLCQLSGATITIGDPGLLPRGIIGIHSWLRAQLQELGENCRASVLVDLSEVRGQDLLHVFLKHQQTPSFQAYYPLPSSNHWWVKEE